MKILCKVDHHDERQVTRSVQADWILMRRERVSAEKELRYRQARRLKLSFDRNVHIGSLRVH